MLKNIDQINLYDYNEIGLIRFKGDIGTPEHICGLHHYSLRSTAK